MKTKFLVVWEDLWHNKESVTTERIGDAIKQFIEGYDLVVPEGLDIDIERYNSDNPYDVGTMGLGFYDIDFNDQDDEYAGRIMIFQIDCE